jgi:hypothetical protein
VRPNGLLLVIDMALGHLGGSLASCGTALKLGALREDVVYVPVLSVVVESLSLSHSTGTLGGGYVPLLTTSPEARARRYFDRACAAAREGRNAEAFVQLGRAAHILIDMACPVHATRTAHLDDPYEWFVDGNARELASLPVGPVPRELGVEEIVRSLARVSQQYPADGTNNPFGRALRWLGFRKPLRKREVEAQAREIIPIAAAHMIAFLELFLSEVAVAR